MRATLRLIPLFALLLAAACGREAPPPTPAPPTLEVRDAAFVVNPDGSATLSAKVVNKTEDTYVLSYVPEANYKGQELNYLDLRFFDPHTEYPPGKSTTIGHVADQTQIRLAPAPALGSRVTLHLGFWQSDDEGSDDLPATEVDATIDVPVVTRTAAHDSVLGTRPNESIRIEDGKIFVIPGQKQALIDGSIVSTVHDIAYELPTAVHADGTPIPYRHNTATGGPYGLFAEEGKTVRITSPPYVVTPGEFYGDFDYFDAADLTIGEKISVTIPFASGDVVGTFTVVEAE